MKIKELKVSSYLWIQSKAHLAFLDTQGMFSIALNNLYFSFESLIYVSRSKLYISDGMYNKKEEIDDQEASSTLLTENKQWLSRKFYQNECSPLQSESHRMPEPEKVKRQKDENFEDQT